MPKFKISTLEIGQTGENQACVFLEEQGLKLLTRNYRSIFGEIDIVMRDKDEIVFIEVRKRSRTQFMSAIESITPLKQRKIIKTAIYFLQTLNTNGLQYRFDVVGIDNESIEWIKDAFTTEIF